MDEEKWDSLNIQVKAYQWEAKARWPISWKSVSLTLRHAADRLYELYNDANNRRIGRALEEFEKSKGIPGSRALTLEGQDLEDEWDGQLISVYFLLMGYSIENLLKAILIIRHPEYFNPEKLLGIKTHDLVDLCRRCEIEVHDQETTLLSKLTAYIEWQGKYPIPLKSEEMWPKKKSDGTWEMWSGEAFHGPRQQQEVESLYTKIWNALEHIKSLSVNSLTFSK